MSECTRCGWTGPSGTPNCPRCGQPFAPSPPPPPPRHTLILRVEASELPSDEFEVTDASQTIGRQDDADITIPHKSVSRQHARIAPTPTGFEIEDLGSTNGTYVNDRPISDRTPLAHNDLLLIGDVPVRVILRHAPAPIGPIRPVVPVEVVSEPRWPQPQVQAQPRPQPLPVPERPAPATGPSTVYYDLDEALAEAQVQPQPQPQAQPRPQAQAQPQVSNDLEVPTAWDVKPARPIEATPVQPSSHSVEQPTLVGADLVAEPPPPPTREPRPTPPREVTPQPVYDPRPTPALDPLPTPARDPLPTPALDPLPTPAREATGPTYAPRPTPALDPLPTPARDPLPTPARDPLPTPALDPLPTPPREVAGPTYAPRPTPALDPLPTPHRDAASGPAPATDLSATALIDLADQLATALRQFKGDANLALWLFDHAGGQPAAHAFADQLARLQRNPDSLQEQTRLLEQAPTAARLLEAAVLLANVVSSLGAQAPTDHEAQSNATNLEPIARA